MRISHLLLAGVAVVVLAGCPDPPPPRLAEVIIFRTSNDDATSMTYKRLEGGTTVGDSTKGITIANGLTIALTLGRSIGDPPRQSEKLDALKAKPYKLLPRGDVFTVFPTRDIERVLISAQKLGRADLELQVEGLAGSVIMPVTVVEQGQVPPDVEAPDAPTPSESDAGATDQ